MSNRSRSGTGRSIPTAILFLLLLAAPGFGQNCYDYRLAPPPKVKLGNAGGSAVEMLGDYGYVAAGEAGIRVLDMTVAGRLTLATTVPTSGASSDLAVAGGALLVATASGLQIFSLADPAMPVAVGWLPLTGGVVRVLELDGIAYLSCGGYGLRLVDIGVASAPILLGGVDTPGWASDTAVLGAYACVADGNQGLQVVDVADPAAPAIVGHLAIPNLWMFQVSTVATSGGFLYAALSWDQPGTNTFVYLVHPGPEPSWVPTGVSWPLSCPLVGTGGELLMAHSNNALSVLEVGGTGGLTVGDTYTGSYRVQDAAIAGSHLLLVDYATPTQQVATLYPYGIPPPLVFGDRFPANVVDFRTAGSILAIVYGTDSNCIQIDDRTDPGGGPWCVVICDRWPVPAADVHLLDLTEEVLAVLPSAGEGPVTLFDFISHAAPGTLPHIGDRLALGAGYAYLHSASRLYTYDISSIGAPVLQSELTLGFPADQLHVVGDQVYILSAGSLYRVDASMPTAPQSPVPVPLARPAAEFDRDGNLLYVSQGTSVQALDVSDPRTPLVMAISTLSRGQAPLAVRDGFLYASGNGLHAYAATASGALTCLGSSYEHATTALAYAGARVWSLGPDGLRSVLPQCPIATTVETGPPPPSPVLLAASPNPFNPACEIRFRLPAAGPVRLSVHDLAGRLIALLIDDRLAAGEHRAFWRGADDRGRPVGSGVYFLRLRVDGATEVRKVSLLR